MPDVAFARRGALRTCKRRTKVRRRELVMPEEKENLPTMLFNYPFLIVVIVMSVLSSPSSSSS